VQQPIASPCIDICDIDPDTGLCVGCARTLDEIARWSSGSAEWRAAVIAALAARRTDGGHQAALLPF
jgi:predicted Fe-S protein YdhL (DUF1289 family)